ncbi:MAG: DUF2163 domain-containing protein [Sphingomonadaceae bacterium]
MSHVFFAGELECVALYWQVFRRDGVALGFTSHDRDLWFGGLLHRAAPGMVPSAIRKSAGFDDDSAEVEGALAHDSISEADLGAGRYDGASVAIGLIDWETGENRALYHGLLGSVSASDGQFAAELRSAKVLLELDPVPRSSPLCRAQFCGPGCTLNAARFTMIAEVAPTPGEGELVRFAAIDHALFRHGELVWLDGESAGLKARIVDAGETGLMLDHLFEPAPRPGTRARLREGCDRVLATCASRFGNAANFQGEPFLPGNDLVARYPRTS